MTAQQDRHRKAGTESVEARRAREMYEGMPMVERCARCPGWSFSGSAVDCLAAGAAHRVEVHPETVGWKRPKKKPAGKVEPVRSPTPIRREVQPENQVKKSMVSPLALIDSGKARELHGRNAAGESVYAIAVSSWQVLGYSSVKACDVAIRKAFKREGLVAVRKTPRPRPAGSRRKSGRERGDPSGRVTEARMLVVVEAYEAGISVQAIAAVVWERWEFPSWGACRNALLRRLPGYGVQVRVKGNGAPPIPMLNRREVDELLDRADRALAAA